MLFHYYILGIILIPAVLLSLYAQIKVYYNFNKYLQVSSKRNIRACDLVRQILNQAGLYDTEIKMLSGDALNNYFNPKENIIALSSQVYLSSSISALGVACHEVGHALQYADNYAPIKIRNSIIPVCNFISTLLWPIIFIGMMVAFIDTSSIFGLIFLYSGIVFFGISVLINLLTLPAELDASNRATVLLESMGILDYEELGGAKKVLRAAALTYIAALITSLLNLLRFILIFRRRD